MLKPSEVATKAIGGRVNIEASCTISLGLRAAKYLCEYLEAVKDALPLKNGSPHIGQEEANWLRNELDASIGLLSMR